MLMNYKFDGFKRNGLGQMDVIKPELFWKETKQSHKNLTQKNLCPGRNWPQTALEYNSDTIPSPPT